MCTHVLTKCHMCEYVSVYVMWKVPAEMPDLADQQAKIRKTAREVHVVD